MSAEYCLICGKSLSLFTRAAVRPSCTDPEPTQNHYIMKIPSLASVCAAVAAMLSVASASAQDIEFVPIGTISDISRSEISLKFDPDDMGRVKGTVTDDKGNPVADAVVTMSDGSLVFGGQSKKQGNFSVGSYFGVYTLEVSSPGYAKYKAEVDIGKGEVKSVDVKLTPLDGKPVAASRGNGFTCKSMSYFLNVASKHPAYEGKTLLDVLADAPAVDIGGSELKVMQSSNVQVYVDNKPLVVPFDVMSQYFGSVAASDVRMVRVVSGVAESPAMLYITTSK